MCFFVLFAQPLHIENVKKIEYVGNLGKNDKKFTNDLSSLQRDVQRQIEKHLRAAEKVSSFASEHHIYDVKEQMKVIVTKLEANLESTIKARVENEKQN